MCVTWFRPARKSGQLRGKKGCASKQTDHPLSSVHILTRYFRSLSMTGPADRERRDENWCTPLTMHTTLDMPHILRKKIIIPSLPSWCCLSPRMIIANSFTRLHSNINTARDVHNNNNSTYDSWEFAATFAGHWQPVAHLGGGARGPRPPPRKIEGEVRKSQYSPLW